MKRIAKWISIRIEVARRSRLCTSYSALAKPCAIQLSRLISFGKEVAQRFQTFSFAQLSQSCDSLPSTQTMSNSPPIDTGNPRNKVSLKPGRSLMDWIRLTNSSADLSGTGNRMRDISLEELAQHNKQNDAWLAIRGLF